MGKYKYLHIPVVDLHGYQVVYHSFGILWKTCYVNTVRTKHTSLATYILRSTENKYQLLTCPCNYSIVKTKQFQASLIFFTPCYLQVCSQSYLKASIYLCFHCFNVCSSGWWHISANGGNMRKGWRISMLVLMNTILSLQDVPAQGHVL